MLTKEERRQVCWENAQKSRKPNRYHVIDGVAYVKMSNTNSYMLCDAEDWENWKQYTWHENGTSHYACTHIDGKLEKYHWHLVKRVKGYVVDHINRNRLDNRSRNIRQVTQHVNSTNTKLSKANKSGIKGVIKTKSGKWMAYIFFNGRNINLGTYTEKSSAVSARKSAEEKYFGSLALIETL